MPNDIFLEFHHDVLDKPGPINVQFKYDIEGKNVTNIVIHSSWGTGLPSHPQLVFHDGEHQFCLETGEQINGQTVINRQYFNDWLSKQLIEKMFSLIDEYSPRFTN